MKSFLILLLCCVLALGGSASALTAKQKKVLESGVYYYNTEQTCTTGPQILPTGATTQTGAAGIQKVTPAPFSGGKITPTAIVLHWTAGSPDQSVESFVSGISARGLSVQLFIDGSGNVHQLVDSLDTLTAHAEGVNSKTIGIEIAAGSDGTVETAEREINANTVQKQAVVQTVLYLMQTFGIEAVTDTPNTKGILSHHLTSPSNKSDVGETYLKSIVDAVKNGGILVSGATACTAISGGGDGGSAEENKVLGQQMLGERGLTGDEWLCLLELWNRESGWKQFAINDAEGNNDLNDNSLLDSGETISETEKDAYGIPQSLPGGKMKSSGADWRTNPRTQISWGLDYIQGRYTTPCNAISWHNSHGWY